MGLLDRIKNTFNKTNNEIYTPVEKQETLNSKGSVPITLTRRDGSSFIITPRLDRLGKLITKPSRNPKTGEIKHIPEFSIIANELANARTIHGSTMANICMEIDPKILEDETYTYYIADVLLSAKRIPEIIDQNEHYAGGIKLGELGQVLGCYSDEQVIQGFVDIRNQRHNQHQAREARQENGIEVSSSNPQTHGSKFDDVQVLDPSKLPPHMKSEGR